MAQHCFKSGEKIPNNPKVGGGVFIITRSTLLLDRKGIKLTFFI